ncbi:MAG TPA: DUF1761 domain-containing protein [Burkholderiales bacterium]|nr:DUF1761 domain-containing protein [Burkholderiales bacterium]
MHPTIHVNWVAVLVAVVASFLFGWLWHGPLFGKKWAALMKFPPDMKPDAKVMRRGMVLTLIGIFLTAYTIVFIGDVWRPSAWGGSGDAPGYVYGFLTGLWVWIGFSLPQGLGGVAWEGKSWPLFGLNAAHSFFSLQIVAMIIAYIR